MENIEALKDEALEEAVGGAVKVYAQSEDWTKGHWQPKNRAKGEIWQEHGHKWYRIKRGDTLGAVAGLFGTNPGQIKNWNPATIQNISLIYEGDAIIVG